MYYVESRSGTGEKGTTSSKYSSRRTIPRETISIQGQGREAEENSVGSFAIPRDFLNGIDFDRLLQGKPLGQELTRFALETPWNDQIF